MTEEEPATEIRPAWVNSDRSIVHAGFDHNGKKIPFEKMVKRGFSWMDIEFDAETGRPIHHQKPC